MLLANIAAAQQIAVALPEQALLRRHDAPIDRRLVRPGVLVTLSETDETSTELAGRKGRASWV